jgi:hypothetical protein
VDIIIGYSEKGTCMLTDVTFSGDRNVIKEEAEKILKYKELTIESQHIWNVKNSDISNNTSDRNLLKITQKIPEQHTGEARHQGTTENSHIGHCTHTAESTNVEAQNVQRAK